MKRAATDPRQVTFSFDHGAQVIPQGDGTFLLKPGRPQPGRKKLSVVDAAQQSGISEDTIRRLYETGFLEGEQPSPRTTFIYEDSLKAHLDATRDREYWEKENRRQRYLAGL